MARTAPAASSPVPPQRQRSSDRWRLQPAEIAVVLAFWTLFAALLAGNRLMDAFVPAGPAGQAGEAAFWFFRSYLWAAVTLLVFWLIGRFPADGTHPGLRLLLLLAVGLLAIPLMDLARDFMWEDVLGFQRGRRGGGPFSARRGPGGGSPLGLLLSPWMMNEILTYACVVAAGIARENFVRFRLRKDDAVRLEAHAAQLQAQLADARLEALRMQINPHFLFNTLHAVSALVERDPRGVRRMIARLSELLRHTLDGPGEPEVTLDEELAFLQRYLDIMQVRFQGRLEIETRVPPELRDALVPNLILQPLVENAVKHGVSQATGEGRIEVLARREGDRLVLAVRDHGPGLEAPAQAGPGGGVGLRNVRDRLAQLYGEEQSLALRPAEGMGALAEISLPFHTRADLRASDLSELPTSSSHVA